MNRFLDAILIPKWSPKYIPKPFKIHQKSIHKLNPYENITTDIIEGPAKGSTILITLSNTSSETEITFNAELKLSLKAKFLGPLIKKLYKRYLTALMYKISNRDLEK